ncbi:MAG: NAD(P)/FAD-dependent oxidoreductase [bacterium]
MNDFDIIVIGGGHNGLICGAYLSRYGEKVCVLERLPVLGGCASSEELIPECPGFKFNRGGIDHINIHGTDIVKDLELEKHGLKYLWHDPLWFFPFPDGKSLTIHRNIEKTCEEVAKISIHDAKAYKELMDFWKVTLELIGPIDLCTPPALSTLIGGMQEKAAERVLKTLVSVPKIFIENRFESPHLRGVNGWWATQTAFPPTQIGSTLALTLLPVSHFLGMARPEGGSGMLSIAAANVIEANSGKVLKESKVNKIIIENSAAKGVELEDGRKIYAKNGVISAIDAKRVFLNLVDHSQTPSSLLKKIKEIHVAPVSMCKVDVALNRKPIFERYDHKDEYLIATPTVAPSMEYVENGWFDINQGRPAKKPSMWCVCSSMLDTTMAPPGKHTLWLSQFAPRILAGGKDWDRIKDSVAENMINTFAEYAPNVKDNVIAYHVTTPKDFEMRTGNIHGSAFHIDMTMDQSMGFRPIPEFGQYKTHIRKLYLTGSGTHPGGGITGIPGHNTAMEVLADLGKKKRGLKLIDKFKTITGMLNAWRLYRKTYLR